MAGRPRRLLSDVDPNGAELRYTKLRLFSQLQRLMKQRNFDREEVMHILDLAPGTALKILNGTPQGLSLDLIFNCLNILGWDVVIESRPTRLEKGLTVFTGEYANETVQVF
jgi:hypothetical protein